jgi:hypothetical protein
MNAGTAKQGRFVKTWADGFGRWYASVPGDAKDPRRMAREAIRRELEARGELGQGYRVRIMPAPDYWLTTDRALRPVFMEVMQTGTA